ncbi:DUF3419 family protein [Verrucomicrobiota bacterium sgz303538]
MKEVWAEGKLGKITGGRPRVIFGQVHEDASCELTAAREVPGLRRCVVIGSGGCTALSLLGSGADVVDAVDINPAQIHLIEAKRATLSRLPFEQVRNAFEVDASSFMPRICAELSAEARRFWSENDGSLKRGFLQCGVVEQNLAKAMRLFFWAIRSRRQVTAFLQISDREEQKARFQSDWAGRRWHAIFALAFHPWLLSLVYGPAVVRRLPSNAAQSVRANLETALTQSPARDNGYLWQTFLQSYPAESEPARPVYLQAEAFEQIRARLDSLHLHCADVSEWLAQQASQSIDFFALSNILEMVPPEFAEGLAKNLIRAASPGAVVVTRRIFAVESELKNTGLLLDSEASARLQAMDRSPICRHLRLYRVRP